MSIIPSGFFALRTPLLPAQSWYATLGRKPNSGDGNTARSFLRQLAQRPHVREALFIASPDFEAMLDDWLANPSSGDGRSRRVERTVARYAARMAMRPTPFGLFAGTSVGTIGNQTRLELAPCTQYRRHARLDMGYLDDLVHAVGRDPVIRSTLRYRPNTSAYRAAGRLRYVECQRPANREGADALAPRRHTLADVADTAALRRVIGRAGVDSTGATISELAAAVAQPEIAIDAATRFVYELIDAQLLLPALPLPVTGDEPLSPLIAAFETTADGRAIAAQLSAVRDEIAALNAAPPGLDTARWRALGARLGQLPAPVEVGRLFQVDMTKPAPHASLSRGVVNEIARGAELLHRLAPPQPDPLIRFRERFRERYEDRAVPLLEALDDDIGIGLDVTDGTEGEPLLRGLTARRRGQDRADDENRNAADCGSGEIRSSQARDAWLQSRLDGVRRNGLTELVLERRDVDELALLAPNPAPLPGAFSVMATLAASSASAADRGDFLVYVFGFAGPSGARLLGRFCHGDKELLAHVSSHVRAEEALDPDALYAEVVHLPEGRIGNLLARPVLRGHEIVYLGDSGAPRERQILASDLLVSVESAKVVLRDRHTGRRVVPRLTSAHHFQLGVPVYRFLCLLQNQAVASAGAWRWGALDAAPALPRVRAGRVVLSLARWRVRPGEVRAWKGRSGEVLRDAVRTWRTGRGIPSRVMIVEADNALPVDLETMMGVEILHQLIKNNESPPVLEELFSAEDLLCVEGPEGKFTNEVIVPFVCPSDVAPAADSRQRPVAAAAVHAPESAARTFTPGSEWLYVKLYTGRTTADRVIRRLVSPFVTQAREREWMDRWFFVRYADPEWHLRLRFRGSPDVLLRELLPAFHDAAHPLFADGSIWRFQIDTYVREIERYGGAEGIELAESIFEVDSDAVVRLVELLGRGADAGDRWRLALTGIDRLIGDFELDLAARHKIATELRDAFARERRSVPHVRREFGERFRQERASLERLEFEDADLSPVLRRGLEALRLRSEGLAPLVAELRVRESAGRLTQPLADMVGSVVHMHANRLLRAAQQAQEAVLYDFLVRLYDARTARASSSGGRVGDRVSQNEAMRSAE